MTSIELGGVTFLDHPADLGVAAAGWYFTGLKDWYGVPETKASADQIPQGHGAFDSGVDWRSAAVPSFTALYIGATEAEALLAVEAFCALGTSAAQQVMAVTDPLRRTSREVSVKFVKARDHRGRRYIYVDVDTLAADPRRYGAEVLSTTGLPTLSGGLVFPIDFPIDFGAAGDVGRLTTENDGTQVTYSRFVVAGGALAGGFSLVDVEDGREVRLEFPIAATDVVTVDSKTGRAWINDESNSLSGFLTVSQWWSIPAGGSRQVQFNAIGATTGTPILSAYTAPAYL